MTDDMEDTYKDKSNQADGEAPEMGAIRNSGQTSESGEATATDGTHIEAGGEDIAAFAGLTGGSAGLDDDFISTWPAPLLPGLEVLGFQPELGLTEKQRQHVGLLKRMLESEEATVAKPRLRRDHTAGFWNFITRFGTAALLFVVVFLNLIQKAPALPQADIAEETDKALASLDRLETDDIVLAAFEYQPGFATELENAASPVLDRVTKRGARILTISTLPLGPLQAEHFWTARQRSTSSLIAAEVDHLGYLPGGTLGLAQLGTSLTINNPGSDRQTESRIASSETKPFPISLETDRLSMVVVITEDAQRARDWIEQLRPDRANIPLVVVTSAQAAPILRPYLSVAATDGEMHQVAGMVAGFTGAYALSDSLSGDRPTDGRWNAYEMGVLAGGVTILVTLVLGQLNLRRLKSDDPSHIRSRS